MYLCVSVCVSVSLRGRRGREEEMSICVCVSLGGRRGREKEMNVRVCARACVCV